MAPWISPSDSDRALLLLFRAGPATELLLAEDEDSGFAGAGAGDVVECRHLITPEKDLRCRAASSSSSISFSCSMLLLSVVGAALLLALVLP
jgi:hypothetical protein